MIFLHDNKWATTIKTILQKAMAKAGTRPRILRSDCAGEYKDAELNQWLENLATWN